MTGDRKLPRIALLQMNCALGDKSTNLVKAAKMLDGLDEDVDIACLPELFNTGYNLGGLDEDIFDLAEQIPGGETVRRLREIAQKYQTGIIAGLIEKEPGVTGLLYDTAVLIEKNGELAGCYRKSHLYPAENSYFRPGDKLPVFELAGLRVGLAICFEAAFAPIFSTLALKGAQLIANPSAVPVRFEYLQDLRTRARAQDNQCFVAAVNHVGREGDVTYCGRSQLADPRGEIVAMAVDDQEAVLVAELDFALIRNQRLQEPVFRGYRPDLYQFSK